MNKGLNFRTEESQKEYFAAYEKTMKLFQVATTETYVSTSFGDSHVICCGDEKSPPLLLLHAASCGSPIWYPNVLKWSEKFRIYAVDLIGETSKSLLRKKINSPADCAKWLDETTNGLGLSRFCICGLSIGGWNAANYACRYPDRVLKLVLLSPVQTFAKMHTSFFFKIMKMGFHPTRENVENYVGWGNRKDAALSDSIIEQFKLSVMNMSSYAVFPTWLKASEISNIKMPTLVMFGENEFAFSTKKAQKRIRKYLVNADVEIVKSASHLINISSADYINERVSSFIE